MPIIYKLNSPLYSPKNILMKLKLLLFLIPFSILGLSQDFDPSMKISKKELETNYYEKDSTASALVIYDYGNSFIDKETFWLHVQVKQKIKILRPEGVDRGEFEVKLYKGKFSKEKIKNIRGATYNLENGSIVNTTLKSNAIFKEENEEYTLVKFVLPNVKVGSIIMVSYETQSRFMRKFQPWYFQGIDPVIYSEYNTKIPGNYEYNIKLVGDIKLDIHDKKLEKKCLDGGNGTWANCAVTKYVMTNIPAYKPEDFATTPLNYISRIEYELNTLNGFDGTVDKITQTWSDVDKKLKVDKDFGKQINKKNLTKGVLPSNILAIENDLDKAKAIRQFVLDNYKWNGEIKRYDISIKKVLKEKVGDAFEINLLLQNLLFNEGIITHPILLSTRQNGLATKIYPVLTDFNYVIVKATIEDKDYFLDATQSYLSFGELPFKCLNQYGRLIDFENGSYWQDITVDRHSSKIHKVELELLKDNTFSGVVESVFLGYSAHDSKERYSENPVLYKENKINSHNTFTINKHDVIDFDKTKYDFKEKMAIDTELEFIGDKIYLNPFIIKFFEENPFKLQERSYPIDFGYKQVYMYLMKINLKEGLKVLEIPKNVRYALPNKSGSFIFNVELEEDTLNLYFKLRFNIPIYIPEFYDSIKIFMGKVVEVQNNSVVVLKKQ